MKILVTIPPSDVKDTFIPPDIARKLETLGTVVYNPGEHNYSSGSLREALPGVDACITGWASPCFDENALQGADRLRLVAHTGGSVAAIASPALYDRGITVVSGNWLYAESVAEGVIAYILCSLRELPHFSGEVQAGRWRTELYHNEGLLDKSVGLIGFGMVARYLVKMLEPFRVKIRAYDPYVSDDALVACGVERATLEDIVSQSDIISIHAARTPGTFHLVTRELLQTIRDGALLVNTARGNIIDEEALAEELATGRFKAVLDVFTEEPLPMDSGLRGLKNVILIPHMAGPTIDRRRFVTLALIEEIENFFSGRPLRYSIGREYGMSMSR